MLKSALKKITEEKNLTLQEASEIVDILAEGEASSAQMAALLTALKMKGETPDEITGFAVRMRERALKIDIEGIDTIVDSCGTGGDGSNTFNISTASAIVASSSGLNIAKHSNFGFTSKCGSSNVIDALGITLVKTPEEVTASLKKHNIAFIHAPYFHKSTFYVNPVRKDIGIRTIFNFLGPLTNPTRPTGQVLGVSNSALCHKIAETLKNLGCKKALVVNSPDPLLDEISVCGKTLVYRLDKGQIDFFEIYPSDFGMDLSKLEDISGDTPEINAKIIENIFTGNITGAGLDAVILNTAAILWVGNKADSLENGVKLAKELIEKGQALEKLNRLRNF